MEYDGRRFITVLHSVVTQVRSQRASWPNRIRHLSTDQEIAGSSPAEVAHFMSFGRVVFGSIQNYYFGDVLLVIHNSLRLWVSVVSCALETGPLCWPALVSFRKVRRRHNAAATDCCGTVHAASRGP
jgi:hypothetical protein